MTDNFEQSIPNAVIGRLPKYYRYLRDIERKGEVRVSSAKMSKDMGLNASQIRRDLNYFGGFGQQGYGYSVNYLKTEISKILGIDKEYNVVIMGAGNLGHALIGYTKFSQLGFHIVGMFDICPAKIDGELVKHIDELEAVRDAYGTIDIGIICTTKNAAQETAERLERLGVRGIWNFAPTDVTVSERVAVKNVHLNDSLYELCFRMNCPED